MTVLLTRVNRTVAATGPGGGPLPDSVRTWLTEKLTYFSRHYDHTAGHYDFREERMYGSDPRTGALVFPLGLMPRMRTGLESIGTPVSTAGGTIADANPAAFVTDVDGLLEQFQLYPGQDDCLIRVAKEDGGLITAPTGTGKSVLIRMICRLLPKARIHIVTKSANLADEIFQDVSEVVPGVGMIGGGHRRSGRVTVFVADSLHHGMGAADVCLLDECHELVAPKYMGLLGAYTNTKMFGFTASDKGRHDGRDVEMEALCGPVLYNMSYQEAQAGGRVVPINVVWLKTSGPDLTGADPVTRDRFGVWFNQDRNKAIADYVRQVDQDAQVMIMVKTIDHIVELKRLLPEFTMVYAAGGMDPDRLRSFVASGALPADERPMTAQRLRALRKQFADGSLTKVIANYVWSTGVNFRKLSVLVRADASSSEIRSVQIPGRVCRRIPGVKESAVLVDCWDEFDPNLLDRSRSRRRSYNSRGWSETSYSK